MPRIAGTSIPKYRKHRATGQALVTLGGIDHYLGPHGTQTSRAAYDQLIAEWMANGRQSSKALDAELTVAELIEHYRQHVITHYVKNGRPTSEQHDIAMAMRFVRQLYADILVKDFGPLALKAVRQKMVEADYSRGTVNKNVHRIRRLFRWGVENELVNPSVLQALLAVSALKRGKTNARETEPIRPVADAIVEATLPHLPAVVADMVRFQRFTGCRPQEVCVLRPCDVDACGEVWAYVPAEHKTEHYGKRRTVFIGPRAQDVLRPYLLREKETYCFCPADSERKRLAIRHEARRVPVHYGNRPGTNRIRRKPRRAAGNRYDTNSYRRAIDRACQSAFPAPDGFNAEQAYKWKVEHRWAPNQLRHTAATELRKRFGLEAAQVVLGHSMADVTQIYAERDMAKAAAVIREVG
jgi:integrase